MALPVFLRPLLLIKYYWQLVVYRFHRWLQRSNEELFGPLEQIIVAIVITGIAMNPSILTNLGGPAAMGAPYPVPVLGPQAMQPAAMPYAAPPPPPPRPPPSPAPPLPPVPAPPAVEVDVTSPSLLNSTANQTMPGGAQTVSTGYAWLDLLLDLLPPAVRPNPVTLALVLMLINLMWLIAPPDLVRRLKESWDVFWPPWQDRARPSRPRSTESSREQGTGSRNEPREGTTRPGERTDPTAKPKSRERGEGDHRDERSRNDDKKATKVEATATSGGAAEVHEKQSRVGGPDVVAVGAESTGAGNARAVVRAADPKVEEDAKEKERARRKALAEYEAKKASSKTNDKEATAVPPAEGSKAPSVARDDKGQSGEPQTAKSGGDEDQPDSTSASSSEAEASSKSVGDESDPLMAGDYRPLRSILKKSTKKPRQSKNVQHNYFLGMRGHHPHLIPFPHGLHPPPAEPRHTMWWRNIPKDASQLMAPPPPPKAVKEDKEEDADEKRNDKAKEEDKERGKEKAMDKDKETDKNKERDKDKDKIKTKETTKDGEKPKAEKATESEMRARMKEKEAEKEKRQGTATATAKIEQPPEPVVPMDPKVQKATWASQALLCLLLFHIQQQLGLILLAFFVWQQLNTHAASHESGGVTRRQPIAIATAEAEAPSRGRKKEEEIPAEMKEKLRRAERDKSRSALDAPEAEAPSRPRKKDEEIPAEMKEKLRRAERDESRSTAEPLETPSASRKGKERAEPESRVKPDVKESSEKTDMPDKSEKSKPEKRERGGDAGGAAEAKIREKMAKMSPEDRKKYEEYLEQRRRKEREYQAQGGSSTPSTPRALSKDEKEAYLKRQQEKAKGKEVQRSAPRTDDMTDRAEARSSRAKADNPDRPGPAKRDEQRQPKQTQGRKWDDLNDEEKRRYLKEREKRRQARIEDGKGEGSSGLTADEKETL